jgi:subtilase family serine protease
MVPDVAAFADAAPGYVIVCSSGVQGCGPSSGQMLSFVGGTSAATPLVAGMIALWKQKAQQIGAPRPGFVPPLLYSLAKRSGAYLDITLGTNVVFARVNCCNAGPGFDLASGLGSPMADQIAALLQR